MKGFDVFTQIRNNTGDSNISIKYVWQSSKFSIIKNCWATSLFEHVCGTWLMQVQKCTYQVNVSYLHDINYIISMLNFGININYKCSLFNIET